MGAAGSIADKVDKSTFQEISGDLFREELFSKFCDDQGYISKEQLLFLAQQTDVYLSHDWDKHTMARVKRINEMFKSRNIITFFPEERLPKDAHERINEAIDNTRVVIVFVTQSYFKSLSTPTNRSSDTIKLEFGYGCRRKGIERMIAVILDPICSDLTTWYVLAFAINFI